MERAALGKVPTLERADGDTITESLVTMEYLDEVYPEPPLFPKDSWKKAQDKVLVEIFGAKVSVFFSQYVCKINYYYWHKFWNWHTTILLLFPCVSTA